MSYVHAIAGEVHPAPTACNRFLGDGRSELCCTCDRSYREHSRDVMIASGYGSWLDAEET